MKPNVTGPLDSVYALPQNIIVHDNLFEPRLALYMEKTMRSYPMKFGDQAWGDKDPNKFFGQIFFWNGWYADYTPRNLPGPVDFYTYYLLNWCHILVHENAGFIDMHRCLLNGQTTDQDQTIHIDDAEDPTKWTFIYYLNDSDAGTVFYQTIQNEIPFMKVNAKRGRLVCFPSSYAHRAEQPTAAGTKHKWRQTLAAIMQVHAPQNNTLFLPKSDEVDYTYREV